MRSRNGRPASLAALVVTSLLAACGAPPPPPALDAIEWQRVTDDASVFGDREAVQLHDVVAGGPGFVAVGSALGECREDAAVWVSVDGTSWERVPDDVEVFGDSECGHDRRPDYFGEQQAMTDVIVGGPGLVALGYTSAPEGGQRSVPLIWSSADGRSWERATIVDALRGEVFYQDVAAVAAVGYRLVAVGSETVENDVVEGNARAAVWTSTDGREWTRVAPDDPAFAGDDSLAMDAVAAGPSGMVAIGHEWPADTDAGPPDVAIWRSSEGTTWSRVPTDPAAFGDGTTEIGVRALVAGGPGFVAAGYESQWDPEGEFHASEPAIWTSTDGSTWERATFDADGDDDGDGDGGSPGVLHNIADLASIRGSVAAAGTSIEPPADRTQWAEDSTASLWTSADGSRWTLVPRDPAAFAETRQGMMALAFSDSRAVAIGYEFVGSRGGGPPPPQTVVWAAPLE